MTQHRDTTKNSDDNSQKQKCAQQQKVSEDVERIIKEICKKRRGALRILAKR